MSAQQRVLFSFGLGGFLSAFNQGVGAVDRLPIYFIGKDYVFFQLAGPMDM